MSPTINIPADVIEARYLSKRIFGGAQYRLEIGAAIFNASVVNTAELADQLGLSRQSVNQELRLLAQAGLLERLQSSAGDRKVYLKRVESTYWSFCEEATRTAGQMLERGIRA